MPGWTLLVAAHAVAATLALVLGVAQLLRRRFGDRVHRIVGRTWVVLMAFVAGSSFLIRGAEPGSFSWIHILSVVTLVSLTAGVVSIRRRNVVGHAVNMTCTYLGLVGALVGVVAVPTRLVPTSFQADWGAMALLTAGVAGAALAFLLGVEALVRAGGRVRGAAAGQA